MAKISQLYADKNKTIKTYPLTKASATYMDNGDSVQNSIVCLKKEIDKKADDNHTHDMSAYVQKDGEELVKINDSVSDLKDNILNLNNHNFITEEERTNWNNLLTKIGNGTINSNQDIVSTLNDIIERLLILESSIEPVN